MKVLIKKATVLDLGSEYHNKVVDLLIEEGQIKRIAATIKEEANTVIKANGLCVSPGWVDIFADYREPGHEQNETITTGLNAAAAGGFTQVFTTPNTDPAVSTKSIVEFLLKKAEGHIVGLRPLGSISKDVEGKVLSEMMDMQAHGAIAFSDGWAPVQNANLMLKALEYVKAFDGTLIQIPMNASLTTGGLMHEGPVSTHLGMAGIPTLAETLTLHRDIELLRYTGSRLHVTGISSAESVAMIKAAKKEGLNITCSVTPYHLALTDESLRTYNSMYKVMPPLRSEADRKALVKGLAEGTIDCIASHHRPQDWDAKTREFDYAADGMNVQEATLGIALAGLKDKVKQERLAAALSTTPRKIFGLEAATIQKGATAEITIFTTEGSHVLSSNTLQSVAKNNPYIGKELPGKVIGIINQQQIHLNK